MIQFTTHPYLALTLSLILSSSIFAQSIDLEWVYKTNGSGLESIFEVVEDSEGNIITLGTFINTMDMDPGSGTHNLTASHLDLFVQKLDSNRNLIWVKHVRAGQSASGRGLAVDSEDNVHVVFRFDSWVDFIPGTTNDNLTTAGGWDIAMFKVDKDGDYDWIKHIGGLGNERPEGIDVDNDGSVYYNCHFSHNSSGYSLDVNPNSGVHNKAQVGGFDVFTLKLDSAGNFVRATSIKGSDHEFTYDVDVDPNGNVYTVGSFSGTIDFDPGSGTHNLTANSSGSAFIQKLSPSGQFIWAKKLDGTGSCTGYEIVTDNESNVWFAGYFSGQMDANPGSGTQTLTSNGQTDNFLVKLNPNGVFVWGASFGGTSYDEIYRLQCDALNNVYLTGPIYATMDADPSSGVSMVSLNASGSSDFFFSKFDENGVFQWAEGLDGPDSDISSSIFVDKHGDILACGQFASSFNFNPNGTTNQTATNQDGFLVKYRQCDRIEYAEITGCDSVIGPLGTVWTNTGTFIDSTNNSIGCDTFYIADVTVNHPTSASFADTVCEAYYPSPSGKYVWTTSDTYQDTIQNTGGCDSVITIDLHVIENNALVYIFNDTLRSIYSCDERQWYDCSTCMIIIPGEDSNIFLPDSSGSYALVCSTGDCIDTSDCIEFTKLGIESTLSSTSFRVYPNPSSSGFNLQFQRSIAGATLNIYALDGSMIKREILGNAVEFYIDFDAPKGFYLGQLEFENGEQQIFQIVKESH
jgi:hypothetical protein